MTDWTQASQPTTDWTVDESSPSTSWGAQGYFMNGQPIGLLLALTYHYSSIPTDAWHQVTPPTTSWSSA